MPKGKKRKVTSEDQIGSGLAKDATEKVEKAREKRDSRLADIMAQMRTNQSTDSHQ